MLYYPKMPGSSAAPFAKCVAFEKLDGTNLHWVWDREFGWHAFGTRRERYELTPAGEAAFAAAHAHLAAAPDAFRATLANGLDAVFSTHPGYAAFAALTAFTEYLGPGSFAGLHRADESKQTVLIDVAADGFGFVGPDDFVADFGHLPVPRVIYRGKLTGAFADGVRAGKFGVAEGVVCKGGRGGADVWMVKIKTTAYLDRLKRAFADRWEDFWE